MASQAFCLRGFFMTVHATAIVESGALLGKDVTIGPFVHIESNVHIGDSVKIGAHAVIKSGSILEDGVRVHSFAVIGDEPQIKGFNAAIPSFVRIGRLSILREGTTVHRASHENACTVIGENAFLMAYSHVGHDCILGENVTLANGALLAGHVVLDSHVFLGGGAMVHQFVSVGEGAFLAGNATITSHVPPFVIAFERNTLASLNLVGLRRRQFSREEMLDIKTCYHFVFKNSLNEFSFKKRAEEALNKPIYQTEKGKQFLTFFTIQKYDRGFLHLGKATTSVA